jgi:hypothetical protein
MLKTSLPIYFNEFIFHLQSAYRTRNKAVGIYLGMYLKSNPSRKRLLVSWFSSEITNVGTMYIGKGL